MPKFGAHMSVAGGLHRAFDHLETVKGEALQIFTKNQRQWRCPPVTDEACDLFIRRWEECGKPPVASHGAYLVNLAALKEDVEAKSVENFTDELIRSETLRIPYVIIHAGSHVGAGVEAGIKRFARNLDTVIEASKTGTVMVLLETTAGQGTGLGWRFEELRAIIDRSKHQDRLGVCFDTCHVFAAGYELRTPEGYKETMEAFDHEIGLDRLHFFHLNDSKTPLGARRDRHTHIGEGEIGLEGFRNLVNDPRFADQPMTLETPKDEDLADDIRNLKTLRGLVA